MRAVTPIMAGTLPFAVLCGLAGVAAGLDPLQAYAMSFIVFAGASQIAASQLIGEGAPIAVVVLTALVINLRFVMYGAYVAPHLRGVRLRWRALIAFVVTDSGFALSLARFQSREGGAPEWFFFGTGVALWISWQVGGLLGAFAGARVPAAWSLDFIIPLAFLAMVMPLLRERPAVAAALAAGITSVLAAALPYKLGLIAAAAAGIATGAFLEATWTRRSSG